VNPAQHLLLAAVRIYRAVVSPALGAFFGPTGGCRFTPTCSAYAADAVRTHGAISGSWLATRRLCRCHPWGGWGHDPVLPKLESHPGKPAGLPSVSSTVS
jgi:putative membrane protein insertion efficiency factor